MKKILLFLFCLIACTSYSQTVPSAKLKVFIDCSRTFCDRTFMISEIRVVDFLLDRLAADVHVLITSQAAGSGGSRYQLIFYGQHQFQSKTDTLFFTTAATATASEIRDRMTASVKLGLLPYLSRSDVLEAIKIDMKGGDAQSGTSVTATEDPWNYWIFRVGASGELNGEKVYTSNRISSDLSAQRTTEKWKTEFYAYGSKRRAHYEYPDGDSTIQYDVVNSDYGFFHNLVRSFNAHWSYGYQASFSNNTFSNFREKTYFNPAIEYNIYPYSEVNNRFFVVRYGVDVTRNHYYDSTIYDKLKETLYGHRFSAALTLNQKWGTFNSGLYYRNYFHDWSIRSMGINLNLNVRITGGLFFELHTTGGIVHDQVYLVKGGATEQEVLTRRRQLASSYNYRTSFGLNYRFGSKLNNFINPRFDGYGGF